MLTENFGPYKYIIAKYFILLSSMFLILHVFLVGVGWGFRVIQLDHMIINAKVLNVSQLISLHTFCYYFFFNCATPSIK